MSVGPSYSPSLPPAPTTLRVGEGRHNPAGFHDSRPALSWRLAEPDQQQTAYQIEAHTQEGQLRWDSGKIASAETLDRPWGGDALASREHITWRVRVWDQHDERSAWSESAWFEMGLLENNDWAGQWIHPSREQAVESPVRFRRVFAYDADLRFARLHLTARGIFSARVNDQLVSEDVLAPGWTPYEAKIETRHYDVSRLLRTGANTLAIDVAPGWFAGDMINGRYGPVPELLAQLELTAADDTRTTIATDADWQLTLDGPITLATPYAGEDYDARREITTASYGAVEGSPVEAEPRLRPKRFPPVRITETITPVSATAVGPGCARFDLGQNLVGVPEITLPGLGGQTIEIRVAEMLNADGSLYRDNYRRARSLAHYTPNTDGPVHYRPTFTFFGFRHVEIRGFDPAHEPNTDWLRAQVMHTDFAPTGEFESSHAQLNQLHRNIRWGLRGNFLDIPTDCPQRNERLGWTGDAQVFAPVALYHYDTHAFWASWLESLRLEQCPDGAVPNMIPAGPRFADSGPAAGWADAAVIIPWEVYQRIGDRHLLEENYPAMQQWLALCDARSNDGLQPDDGGFGDWLQPVMYAGDKHLAGKDRCFGETPRDFIATCYHGHCARLMAGTAAALGHTEDATGYTRTHARIQQALTARYFDADGHLTLPVETQTGYVLPLAFGLVPQDRETAVAAHLVNRIARDGDRLNTGFLGTAHLLNVLDTHGHSDLACRLLFTRGYPSWFYSIDQGATTIWERWNSYSHEHGFGEAKMNSFNHYAYGAVGQFLYERLAGLAPAAPGYRELSIHPLFYGHPLTSASARLDTRYGRASNAWERDNDLITMTTQVPAQCTATISLPLADPQAVEIQQGHADFKTTVRGIEATARPGTLVLRFPLPPAS